jgi:Ca2+-binding EF-hand superfamily protein
MALLQLKPVRKGYLGRTNKWGGLGRPADPTTLPLSDRFAPLTPARARSDQRAEVARSLRPHTANERLAATLPSPMHIRPRTVTPLPPSFLGPVTRTAQLAVPGAQHAIITTCPQVAHSRDPSGSLAGVFKAWDKKHSGTLSQSEFQAALLHLGVRSDDPATQALAGIVDADGSGAIDYAKLAGHLVEGMTDATGAASGGITSELRTVLDQMHAGGGCGGDGGGAAGAPAPAPTHAQQVLMARVRRAAEARAEEAEEEAARRRLLASWRSPATDAPSRPAAPPRPAAEAEVEAKIVDEAAEARARREERRVQHRTHDILSKIKCRLEASGTTTKEFMRNPETGSDTVGRTELEVAISRLGLPADGRVVARLMDELGMAGADGGGMAYRHAVARLLSSLEMDHTGNGSKTAGHFHKPSRTSGAERAVAMSLMSKLRATMMQQHGSVRAAFQFADTSHNDSVSMGEFCDFVERYVPGVPAGVKHDAFTMLDKDSSGHIGIREFSAIIQADDNNVDKTSQAAIALRWEQQGQLLDRRTRFGATPARSYGMLVNEMISPIPGSPAHATDSDRLQRVSALGAYGKTPYGPCAWQAEDKAVRAQRQEARYANIRQAVAQMHQAHVVDRCAREDAAHEAKLAAKLAQKERYATSTALENRRLLGY